MAATMVDLQQICLYILTIFVLLKHVSSLSSTLPNFIFILSDDQDALFNSSDVMPNLQKYLVNEGITFEYAYVATPICCPSRTETITGRNYQNIGAPNGSCMHINTKEYIFSDNNTMFQSFHNNGYLTAMFGKLTNDMTSFFCGKNPTIDGFDRIQAPCDFNDFYGLK